jgi:CRP-like cAMP-binding protein
MDNVADLDLKKASLRKQTCFSQLTDTEIEKLANLLTEKKFKAHELIVNEGEPVDSFYLIVDGTANVQQIFVENNTLTVKSVATLKPGDAIGLNEAGFYSLSGMRTATVIASTDMTLYYLSTAEFNGFSLAHPHVHEVMRKNAEAIK